MPAQSLGFMSGLAPSGAHKKIFDRFFRCLSALNYFALIMLRGLDQVWPFSAHRSKTQNASLAQSSRPFNLNNNQIMVLSVLLSIVAFVVDLNLRWAIGGLMYILVILLSLQSSQNHWPYFFAATSSGLIVISLTIAPPTGEFLRVIANRVLDLTIIWLIPIWFLHYKAKKEADSKLASIVNFSEDAIFSISLSGIISGCNKSAQSILGYGPEEMIGKPVNDMFSAAEQAGFASIMQKIRLGEGVRRYESVQQKKDGTFIDVAISVSPIRDVAGNVTGCSIIARDITENKAVQKKEADLRCKLQAEKSKLEQVLSLEEGLHKAFDLNQLVDFVINKTAQILSAKKCSLMLVDEQTRELCIRGQIGLDESVVVLSSTMKLGDPIAGLIAVEGKAVLVEDIESDNRFSRKNRPTYKGKSFVCAPIKLGERVIGVISVADKISENEGRFNELDLKVLCMIVRQVAIAIEASKLYRDLIMLTITDPLTGIFNFRHLSQVLDHEIYRSKRYDRPLSVLMIDVDDFKKYNDSFGHLEGDNLLKTLAMTFKESVRDSDVVCRYAGDEFVVILTDTGISEADIVAKKIMRKIPDLALKSKITLSIGAAQLPLGIDINRYEFISKVDSALYRAKKDGKNRICLS